MSKSIMVARASTIFYKTNYESENKEQMLRGDQFTKPKTDPRKMPTLQATEVVTGKDVKQSKPHGKGSK